MFYKNNECRCTLIASYAVSCDESFANGRVPIKLVSSYCMEMRQEIKPMGAGKRLHDQEENGSNSYFHMISTENLLFP